MTLISLLLLGVPLVLAEQNEHGCSDKRPYWSTTYLTCIQCRTSIDCPNAGEACYSGECSQTCPPGMYKTEETLNPEYYLKLDEFISTDDTWEAFAADDDADSRKKLKKQYEKFNEDNEQYFGDGGIPSNLGQEMNVCRCSTAASYYKASSSWTTGMVPGHPYSDICACKSSSGYCEGYMEPYPWAGGSTSLVPRGKPANCWGETSSLRLRFFGLTIVALGIAVFAYRSSSSILSDFHRFNLFNILCTWIFVFMYMIDDPHQGGYSRFLGAGIFLHNAAEWNFMIRLWFGHSLKVRQVISWWGMMFLAIMMILIMLLPLHTQLVLAGTLGAMLDVTFILMSVAMIVVAKENNSPGSFIRRSLRVGESRFTGFLFLIAYLAHILALQSIFGAMGSGDLTVEIWILTLIFTFFQFILLEMFAYNQDHRSVWCMPYDQSSYDTVLVNEERHRYMLVDNVQATSTANPGILVKTIQDGELDTNPEVSKGRPDRLVYDLGIFPDGLNDRIRGCKEIPCCSKYCSSKIPPFAVYITIGFVAALIVNLSLFVFKPQAVKFDELNNGDCPSYYPLYGNHGVPEWIHGMSIDHPFRQKYATLFWKKIDSKLNVIGVVVGLVLFGLLLVLIRIQAKFVQKIEDVVPVHRNSEHNRDSYRGEYGGETQDGKNLPPTRDSARDLEMAWRTTKEARNAESTEM